MVLAPLDVEVAARMADERVAPAESEAALLAASTACFGAPAAARIQETLAFAKSLESRNSGHPDMLAYMRHPVRVARLTLRLQQPPQADTIQLALIHNVFELAGLAENDLVKAGYDERTAQRIRLLTIDRDRQYDPAYLPGYYDAIEAAGDDVALVKCADKLDNILGLKLLPRTKTIITYLEMADQFVVPMASRLAPELGRYVAGAIALMMH
jgi:(p)ppGpp synthase/HD superfamily hydrolase